MTNRWERSRTKIAQMEKTPWNIQHIRPSKLWYLKDIFFPFGGQVSLRHTSTNFKVSIILCQKRTIASLHPPKFNSSPLRNGGWKTLLSYWGPVTFQGRKVKEPNTPEKSPHTTHQNRCTSLQLIASLVSWVWFKQPWISRRLVQKIHQTFQVPLLPLLSETIHKTSCLWFFVHNSHPKLFFLPHGLDY